MERKNIFFTINDNLESANWFKNSFGYPFAQNQRAKLCPIPYESALIHKNNKDEAFAWKNDEITI